MRGYAIGSRQIRHVFGWPTSAQQLLKCSIRNVRLIRSRSTVNDVRAQSQLGTIEQAYHDELSSGLIQADSFQAKIVARLQSLDDHLDHYEPAAHSRNRFWTRLFRNSQITSKNQVRGLYVHGTVGCGKTMLMDMFFHNCRVSPDQKHRTHFHAFMLDVHSRIHENKKQMVTTKRARDSLSHNPIPIVAQQLLSKHWLLCLDEFQVIDIGDAMILKQLFAELFKLGAVLVTTSNRAPDDLYKQGLQRAAFLPFIPLLKNHCDVLPLDSGIDYRTQTAPSNQPIYLLTSKGADESMNRLFKVLASRETDHVRERVLSVGGRDVRLQRTCGRVADCEFEELCDRPLGAADYIAIGQLFHTLIIRNIPQMNERYKGQARRFITLIDTLYEQRTRVLFTAQVPLSLLFRSEKTNGNDHVPDDDQRKLMDDLGIQLNSEDARSSIFSGQEEVFAFDRTLSRIAEMQTDAYWKHREPQT